MRAIADCLSAWIENQSRTLNDGCAFEKNDLSTRTKREWTYKNKYIQNKNLWFCSTAEEKEEKLLTGQQNQSFCYHIYWCWKQIDSPGAAIGCIL